MSSSLFLFFLGTSFAAGCGDGIIDAGETCDDGNTNNRD
ncbi:MAG: hypothetical protein Q8O99_05055 [bacterium]|nr:hypothetical protein [bacterium]